MRSCRADVNDLSAFVHASCAIVSLHTYNQSCSADTNDSELKRPLGRVLGLDVGSKRIGVAISDPLGITAQGLQTIRRQNKRLDFAALEALIKCYEVREIVVGLPLRLSGEEGMQSGKMREFAAEMKIRFHFPVHLWDERLTSAEANRGSARAKLASRNGQPLSIGWQQC